MRIRNRHNARGQSRYNPALGACRIHTTQISAWIEALETDKLHWYYVAYVTCLLTLLNVGKIITDVIHDD